MEAQPSGEITAVDRIFHHQHAVSHGNGQRAPAAAFAGNRRHDGNLQAHHLAQIVGDGFRLAAFFGAQSGICAGSVHESE